MTKSFKVAGHIFSLTMPETCSLWGHLSQYEPFALPSPEPGLFTVELADDLPEGERECVYDAPTEPGETVIRLYRQGEDWLFEMLPDSRRPVCARMLADPGFSNGKLQLLSRRVTDALFGVNNGLMLLYAFTTATLGTLEMHASVVSNGGKGYLFLGKSGTGKSTHSRQWLQYIEGSELMNDDNPIVRVLEDGRVMVYGSPWSGKTPCYRNVEAPVGAFVQIRQCPENRITRMGALEAYATLYSSCSGFKADSEMADGLHSTMEKTVFTVPCYVLDCRPDEEAARVCAGEVRK